jgi:hypothetical protein
MNDASELSYANDLIGEVVAERFSMVQSDSLRDVLPTRPGFANAFRTGAWPFVACFCEDEDLLSQWRGYLTGEVGYSLGFNLSLVLKHAMPPRTYLRKVIYEREVQRQHVANVVDAWVHAAASLLTEDTSLGARDLFPYPAIWALQEALAEHHLCFKHPAFAEEREWRLIKLVHVDEELRMQADRRHDQWLREVRERTGVPGIDTPDMQTGWPNGHAEGIEIRFRPSPMGVIPYVEIPMRDPAGVHARRLPLEQVVQGPTPHAELALSSLARFLESHEYGFHTKWKQSATIEGDPGRADRDPP